MRLRSTSIGVATAVLVLASTGTANAATDDYRVDTSATGVSLTILDQPVLRVATTDAGVDGGPTARATGVGAAIAGTPVPGTTSTVEVSSGQQSDADNCASPALPGDLATLVSVQALCSTAVGAIGALPTASSEAGIGAVSVDAAALTEAITAIVLDPVEDQLATVFEDVENEVNTAVQDALEEACATSDVPLNEVQAAVEELLGDALDPVTEQLPDNDACSVLLQFVAAAPQLSDVQAAVDALIAALLDAVADLGSIDASLGARSEVAAVDGLLRGTSSFGTISLQVPSLDLLGDVVATAFDGPVGDYLQELSDLVGGLGADAPEVPELQQVIADVLDALGLSDLLADPAPLLTVDVTGSRASVDLDPATTAITPTATAGSITVRLSPSLAALFGAPESTEVGPGDEVVLAEGTPLESRLAVGASSTTATSATGELVTVELLRTISGGVLLEVGRTTAEAAAAAPIAPAPLPVTGGGAMLGALLALGAARGLQRR